MKRMPWWGWLLIPFAPVLLLATMLVVMPLAFALAFMVNATCWAFDWEPPEWIRLY